MGRDDIAWEVYCIEALQPCFHQSTCTLLPPHASFWHHLALCASTRRGTSPKDATKRVGLLDFARLCEDSKCPKSSRLQHVGKDFFFPGLPNPPSAGTVPQNGELSPKLGDCSPDPELGKHPMSLEASQSSRESTRYPRDIKPGPGRNPPGRGWSLKDTE